MQTPPECGNLQAGPQDPAGLGGGCGRVGEVEGVDGHGRVCAGLREPGAGEVTDDEPCPAGQTEQHRPVRSLVDCDG
jgi:hypothetical protein